MAHSRLVSAIVPSLQHMHAHDMPAAAGWLATTARTIQLLCQHVLQRGATVNASRSNPQRDTSVGSVEASDLKKALVRLCNELEGGSEVPQATTTTEEEEGPPNKKKLEKSRGKS